VRAIEADGATFHLPGTESAEQAQRLLDTFRNYERDVENLLPASVDSEDSYDRFVTIMRHINEHLFPAFLPDRRIPLYAPIVVRWLKGQSLAEMIRRNIEYHRFRLLVLQTAGAYPGHDGTGRTDWFPCTEILLCLHGRPTLSPPRYRRADLIGNELDIATQLEFCVSSLR
jgi:hypothetical protein